MIRKDQLPKIWGDEWRCEAPVQELALGKGEECCLVLCDPQDAPMFMLRDGEGYRTLTYRRVYDTDGNLVAEGMLNPLLPSGGPAMDTYYEHNS